MENKRNNRAIERVHVNTKRLTKALELWGGNVYDLSEELGRGRGTIKNIASGNKGHQNPPAAFIKMVCERIHADYDWIIEPETPSPTPIEAAIKEADNTELMTALNIAIETLIEIKEILRGMTSKEEDING